MRIGQSVKLATVKLMINSRKRAKSSQIADYPARALNVGAERFASLSLFSAGFLSWTFQAMSRIGLRRSLIAC
jgi:hypothetical protein